MTAKLGPHVILLTDPVRPWVEQAPVVKALDDPTPLKLARSSKVLVFRKYFPDQDLGRLSPERAVREIISALGGFNDPRLYVELLNECYQYMWWGFADYVAWTARAAELLHQAGYKVAGFSFSTGTPRLDTDPGGAEEWLYLKAHGYAGVDAIAIHAYWGQQGFTEWHALRHRRVHEILGPGHPPFVITECGRDAVEGGQGGWRRDGISAEEYAQELLAYDAELARDDYVLGAAVFTSRSFDPTWDPFAVEDVVPFVLRSLPGQDEAPAPTPTPTQPPASGSGQSLWELFKWAVEATGGQATLDGFKTWLAENGYDPARYCDYGYPCEEAHPMAFKDQFPDLWRAWTQAGGDETHFFAYLVGVGALPPTRENLLKVIDALKGDLAGLEEAVKRLPLA